MFDRFEQIYTIVLLYHLLVSSMSKTQRRILINEIQKIKIVKQQQQRKIVRVTSATATEVTEINLIESNDIRKRNLFYI